MKTAKKEARRKIKYCQGCKKDIPRGEWDEHIMKIIRSLRV